MATKEKAKSEADELAMLFADVEAPAESAAANGAAEVDPSEIGVEVGDEPPVQATAVSKPLRGAAAKAAQAKAAREASGAGGETVTSSAGSKVVMCPWCHVGHKTNETHVRPLPEGKTFSQAVEEETAAVAATLAEKDGGTSGESAAYAKRKAEIDAAKAKGKKGKAAGKTKAAKGKAAKAAGGKKTKAQASSEDRTRLEAERKARLAEKQEKARQERALKAVPAIIGRLNKDFQTQFAEDYATAGPKTERNPGGKGIRRAKADRNDFAAGWVMAMARQARKAKAS